MPVRLYLDEDVIPELARLLRQRGYDAVSAHETGMEGKTDEEQMQYALGEGRVVFSYNYRHYLPLARSWFAEGRRHAGIILSYRQYSRKQLGPLLQALLRLLNSVSDQEMANSTLLLEALAQE